jgi:hypothetical protein
MIWLFIWNFSDFLNMQVLIAIKFPLRTAFPISQRFLLVVFNISLDFRNFMIYLFISSMTHLLRFTLLPKMWSILEKVPWAAEKSAYFYLLNKMPCMYLLGPFNFVCSVIYFCGFCGEFFFFGLGDQYIVEKVSKFPSIIIVGIYLFVQLE